MLHPFLPVLVPGYSSCDPRLLLALLQASLEPAKLRKLTYLKDTIRMRRHAGAALPRELASMGTLGQRRQGYDRSKGASTSVMVRLNSQYSLQSLAIDVVVMISSFISCLTSYVIRKLSIILLLHQSLMAKFFKYILGEEAEPQSLGMAWLCPDS
jgi:hypothetical protein